jgi:hypothetical protein
MFPRYSWVLTLYLLLPVTGCEKFLDKPADSSWQTLNTVASFQGIMDKNSMTSLSTPGLGPVYVNDYRLAVDTQPATDSFLIGAYTWQLVLCENSIETSWGNPYDNIYACNTVLTELPQLTGLDSADLATSGFVLGQAFFERAFMYYNLEETFGQPYRPSRASADPGVPLRLTENVLYNAPRASVATVYQQIVADLQRAVSLLPVGLQMANRNRPCRSAAYGLLAKVWLTCQDYVRAEAYADSSLQWYSTLVDYNTLDSNSLYPFAITGNEEVLFQSYACNNALQYGKSILIDSLLYRSYAPDDLRRVIFFTPVVGENNAYSFKGQYTGLHYLFSGVAVDEILLIRAEARAWNGNLAGALADVNTLLSKRWRYGRFVPYTATTQDAVLRIVLMEKRKETLFREGRYYDLRRLNQYPAYADTLSRVYRGTMYTVLPGSASYAWPIPLQEINLDGEKQNPE